MASEPLRAKLRGVPQLENAYHNELNRDEWGLIEVPRVENFRGLLFANFDREAGTLADYLGDMAWYLDLVLNRSLHGTVAMPGCHRWRLGGNWKLAAEQFTGDNYHTDALHRSMAQIGLGPQGGFRGNNPWERDFEVNCGNGHGWINFDVDEGGLPPIQAEYFARLREEARAMAPYQSATGLQVTSAVLTGIVWAIENPLQGIVETDEMDFERCLEIQMPYLGPVGGVYTAVDVCSVVAGRGAGDGIRALL